MDFLFAKENTKKILGWTGLFLLIGTAVAGTTCAIYYGLQIKKEHRGYFDMNKNITIGVENGGTLTNTIIGTWKGPSFGLDDEAENFCFLKFECYKTLTPEINFICTNGDRQKSKGDNIVAGNFFEDDIWKLQGSDFDDIIGQQFKINFIASFADYKTSKVLAYRTFDINIKFIAA